jgi:hypothetical protein
MKVSIDMHRSKQPKKCIHRKSAVIKNDLYIETIGIIETKKFYGIKKKIKT